MKAVETENLSKTYSGGKTAVNAVSLALEQDEIFGFLGPNGAGKTTAVKVLNGMLAPTTGSCLVLGIDPSKRPEEVHALSGVVTERAQMYGHPTGMQNLVFYGTVFGLSRKADTGNTSLLSIANPKAVSSKNIGILFNEHDCFLCIFFLHDACDGNRNRADYQRTVFLILPVLLLVVGQFTGILLVSTWLLLGLGIVLAVIAGLLMRGAMGKFDYESLLR